MSVRLSKRWPGLILGCLALAMMPALAVGEESGVPDAKKTLSTVQKNLTKATAQSSFNVTCSVQGGLSRSKDHALNETTVNQSFDADIYHQLMRLNSVEAYRSPAKGAIRNLEKNVWQDTLATPQGVLMQRLLSWPHDVVQNALASPEKIEWIWVGDEEVPGENEEEAAAAPEDDVKPGSTSVAKEKAEKKEGENRGIPHLIRVQLQPKIALEMFTETQNSGCVSGG